jgi:nucleoside-diphosphate-sugar epimerase
MTASVPKTAAAQVLVTGATGFVGSTLCRTLVSRGYAVRAAMRQNIVDGPATTGMAIFPIGEMGSDTTWRHALHGCDAVVHLAARVHVMRDRSSNPLAAFRAVNVDATRQLLKQAAESGVRRFVFLSTIKVNGEMSVGKPFRESDPPAPLDPYAISKWEAEKAVIDLCNRAGMEFTILRPPLVYGPGVGGNFARLLKAVDRGVPLPFGALRNRRSLIYVENLADLIAVSLGDSVAAGKTYLVSDDDVSTPELIRRTAVALGKQARLISVPLWLLRIGAGILGRASDYERLAGDLAIDPSAVRGELGWAPPFEMSQALAATAAWYRSLQAPTR